MPIYLSIPTINNLKYLKQTLESIHNSDQGEYEFRIQIIDNASTDNTAEWLKTEGKILYDDLVENKENLGAAASWNVGINWGMGHIDMQAIMILNNDIVLGAECLKFMAEDLVESGFEFTSGINLGNKPEMLSGATRPHLRYSPATNFSCFGLSEKCIKRVGLFDENFKIAYYEDNDYFWRMRQEGVKAVSDMWAHFIHYGSRSIKEGGVKHEPYFGQNRQYFIKKWGFNPEDGKRV